MKRRIRQIGLLLVPVLLGAGIWQFWPMLRANLGEAAPFLAGPVSPGERARWAVRIECPGVENLHRVTEDLYRGAQPTAEGMRQLKAMGIRTVVNLRAFHCDDDEIGQTALACVQIRMNAWRVEDEDLVRFLRVVSDPKNLPVFVHCLHGSDRTGTVCAVYRIAVCGWSKDQAIREMMAGGFGFHDVFENLPEYLRDLDVDDLKRRAERITPPRAAAAGPSGTVSSR